MNVSIKLTPAEISSAMNEIRRDIELSSESDFARRIRSTIYVLALIPVGYLWAYFLDVYGAMASWYFAGSVLLVALTNSGSRRLLDEKINRYIESGSLLDPAEFSFNESGITVDGGSIRSEISWSSIIKVRDCEDFILLFIDKSGALIIPKRLEEIEEILELASRRSVAVAS